MKKNKNKKKKKPSVINKACVNKPRGGANHRQQVQKAQGGGVGGAYLLLDVAVGHRDGTRGSGQEVLVGRHLTRLHRSTSGPQLLLREKEQMMGFSLCSPSASPS